ncbi:hypothetical protein E2C01_028252 [Portunus trituberculatus]|uniref:Uncharacterized protein n=1 Tax=Portunus trituberculatus TaxID=210409 RepID=A0A5B7ENK9_PORTR|nr:hypothetical protein [Portunus trituberculatus]
MIQHTHKVILFLGSTDNHSETSPLLKANVELYYGTPTALSQRTDGSNNNARLLPLCHRTLFLGSGGQPAVRIVTPDAASAPEDAMVPRLSYDISESYLATNTHTTGHTTRQVSDATPDTCHSYKPYTTTHTIATSSHIDRKSRRRVSDVSDARSHLPHPAASYPPLTDHTQPPAIPPRSIDRTATRQIISTTHKPIASTTRTFRRTNTISTPYRAFITSHHLPPASSTQTHATAASIPYSVSTIPADATPPTSYSTTTTAYHPPVTSTFSNPSYFSYSTMNVDSSPDDRNPPYNTSRNTSRISASLTSLTTYSRRPHYHHNQYFW